MFMLNPPNISSMLDDTVFAAGTIVAVLNFVYSIPLICQNTLGW